MSLLKLYAPKVQVLVKTCNHTLTLVYPHSWETGLEPHKLWSTPLKAVFIAIITLEVQELAVAIAVLLPVLHRIAKRCCRSADAAQLQLLLPNPHSGCGHATTLCYCR